MDHRPFRKQWKDHKDTVPIRRLLHQLNQNAAQYQSPPTPSSSTPPPPPPTPTTPTTSNVKFGPKTKHSNQHKITEIPPFAFSLCPILPSTLIIPNTVTHIRERAFFGCTKLQTIFIPSSVQFIGPSAFMKCSNVSSIHFDSSSSNNINSRDTSDLIIHGHAFAYMTSLEEIQIPPNIRTIPERMCIGNKKITSLTIPPSVEYIAVAAFEHCTNLSKLIFQLEGKENNGSRSSCGRLEYIERYAFAHTSLKVLHIPSCVHNIGLEAFGHCHDLISILIPENRGTVAGGEERSNCAENDNYCRSEHEHDQDEEESRGELDSYFSEENDDDDDDDDDDDEHMRHFGMGFPHANYNPRDHLFIESFTDCHQLTSVYNGNPTFIKIRPSAFDTCAILNGREDEATNYQEDTDSWLCQRFDNLPIHQICYQDTKTTFFTENHELHWTLEDNKKTIVQQDALGMNALHVLCANPTVTYVAIQKILSVCPPSDTNIVKSMKDIHGRTPYMLFLACKDLIPLPKQNIVEESVMFEEEDDEDFLDDFGIDGEPRIRKWMMKLDNQDIENSYDSSLNIINVMIEKGSSYDDFKIVQELVGMNSDDNDFKVGGIRSKMKDTDINLKLHGSIRKSLCNKDRDSGFSPFMKAATFPQCSVGAVYLLAINDLESILNK